MVIEKILIELIKDLKQLNTLSSNIIYIKSINQNVVDITVNGGKERDQQIPFNTILKAWYEFVSVRTASPSDFVMTKDFSIFNMALISKLPFVEVIHLAEEPAIKLREFKTDQLPAEDFGSFESFLNEVENGKYDPSILSEQLSGSLYHFKSRCRQDLRLIGLLNVKNDAVQSYMSEYITSKNKKQYLKKLVLMQDYFQVVLECLRIMEKFTKVEKRKALIEIGMLIVRNSQGDNLMLESVAKKRTSNLLSWLENLQLVDQNWIPLNKELKKVDSKLREYFLKISSEYLTAKSSGFGGNAFASFVRHDVPKEMSKLSFLDDKNYSVAASAGKGNWATVPWISILNNEVTNSTQRGYYLVYLFSEDMKRLYLSFSQGVTETSKEDMLRIKKDIRGHITMESSVKKDDNMFIGDSNKAKQYAESTAAYIEYNLYDLPSETKLVQDLKMMVGYYEEYISFKRNPFIDTLYKPAPGNEITYEKEKWLASNKELITHIHSYITAKGFSYTLEEVTNLFLSLKTKPFVILSGISGTGKTKIVQWFAESVGATEENGQFTLIPIRPDWNDGSDLLGYVDIKGDFKPGPFTTVIEKAEQNPDDPYFVLLDEMNLARVEHYFSDVLSVMESRKWENGKMVTSALLSAEMAKRDIRLPVNLYVIGTVNMDETTHPFSKKVLDRANTIEFNRVELSNLSFLEEQVEVEPKLVQDHMFRSKYLHLKDLYLGNQELVKKVTAELEDINKSLQLTNAHIGYRVRDEICFYLAYNEDSELMSFEIAFDHCILQKILPRISGSDTRVERLLEGLYRLFTTKEYIDDEESNEISIRTARYPKSTAKVVEMLRRLRDDGFTSFWIS
ncbi:MrcB family domain-containing protein [Peribacillus frigoritolerans]|uniref:MrcB family domain-containing protein n=1 Tax=Peribacillus frigoritolerans TaxID=450367 RepID=UPI0025A2E426|nr:DUF3578 domain-containing protein [Peribacillus frigoritolerans]MDM5308098.1 DUF3578 domain-containing protein [Peribacillus frigoritolerans]